MEKPDRLPPAFYRAEGWREIELDKEVALLREALIGMNDLTVEALGQARTLAAFFLSLNMKAHRSRKCSPLECECGMREAFRIADALTLDRASR